MFTDSKRDLEFDGTSVLKMRDVADYPSEWCIFDKKVTNLNKTASKGNSIVGTWNIVLASQIPSDGETTISDLKNLAVLETRTVEEKELIVHLKSHLDKLLHRFLSKREFEHEKEDDVIINTIARFIESEDQKDGFEQKHNPNTQPRSFREKYFVLRSSDDIKLNQWAVNSVIDLDEIHLSYDFIAEISSTDVVRKLITIRVG